MQKDSTTLTRQIKYIIFGLTSFFCSSSFGQQNNIDSLLIVIKTAKEDTNKVNLMLNLSDMFYKKGNYEEMIRYGYQASKLAETKNYEIGEANSYLLLGIAYQIKGIYPEALKYYYKSLKIYEVLHENLKAAGAYSNIGIIFKKQKDFKEALKNLETALKLREKEQANRLIIVSLINIANVNTEMGNDDEALKQYDKCLSKAKELSDDQLIASIHANIGNVLSRQKKYQESLEHHFLSLDIFTKNENVQNQILVLYNIGDIYLSQKFYLKAREYFNRSLKIALLLGSKDDAKDLYLELTRTDSAIGDFKNAFINHKMYIAYRDSMTNEESIKQTEREKNQYAFDKKESLAKAEQDKKDAITAKEKQKTKVITYSVSGSLFIVLLLALFIYRGYRQKQKANKELAEKNIIIEKSKHIIEEKNKDITDSINYARRIQKAMLPHRKDIWTAFPQSFVLFKPKDIVSGDFYFFHQRESVSFIASADCTGHGVPGAFMSMIGAGKLNDAVAQSTDTSVILSLLNKGVKSALKQSEANESVTRDGMDIALCSIDTNARIVKYAGANRPIWIIRNGQTAVEEIKATKKAIGGFTEDSQHFDSHEIQFQQGDTFYISTDGFADTFGGLEGKKVTTKRFKEILVSIQDKTMKEQEHRLDNFIETWKGETEQMDDILVIGIRL